MGPSSAPSKSNVDSMYHLSVDLDSDTGIFYVGNVLRYIAIFPPVVSLSRLLRPCSISILLPLTELLRKESSYPSIHTTK
ncbi:hypothetical protein BD410DRAFT_276680 [Rickenella mellea]|uniref:Uncharacterized protein n=1 Tax=Rickenella mellea TaxID=50990 RepID=A0A4Y7Q422_9AGAM|nr:hypothetical protein BD410DRAFT_276680 [Rickenella mellea]